MNLSPYMRPFITVVFVLIVAGYACVGKIDSVQILSVTGMLISFWFGERAALKTKDEEQPVGDTKTTSTSESSSSTTTVTPKE